MSELPPTDEELSAAAWLAEALEARDPSSGADDALAVAQLIRHARDGGALDEVAVVRTRRRIWPALGLAAAAAAAALVLAVHRPPPPMSATRAEARAIAAHDPSRLDAPMRDLRATLLAVTLAAVQDPRAGWLAHARAAHEMADRDLAKGRAPLLAFIAEAPPPQADPDTVRTLRQDAWFRLAEGALALGDAAAARRNADQGLALGIPDDLFVANLLIVRARARELLHDDRGALADYQDALRINEALLAKESRP